MAKMTNCATQFHFFITKFIHLITWLLLTEDEVIKNRHKIGRSVLINIHLKHGYTCKPMLTTFLDYIWKMTYKLMENYNTHIENKSRMQQ